MTIDNILNLPIISVEFYPRVSNLTNLNAYIYDKATRISYVVGIDNISYSDNVATITLTDAELIASINEDSVLSIVFYIETDSSTYLDSMPIYRDLITFKASLDTDSDYLQDSDQTEYIFA
jgi:hypothetical protein